MNLLGLSILVFAPLPAFGSQASGGAIEGRQAEPATSVETGREQGADLGPARTLFDEACKARDAKDLESARAKAAEAIAVLLAQPAGGEDEAWVVLAWELGTFAHDMVGDLRAAERAGRRVLEVFSRTVPEDHPGLQGARLNLAITLKTLGDLPAARSLEEKVLEVYSRTLPDDHPDLQAARLNLATTLNTLGDLAAARVLQEKVLEVRSRTLPDDHPDLQDVRHNLAITLQTAGDLAAARALFELVLEVRSRTLPEDHPQLQDVRHNLAITLQTAGDLAAARALFELVLEVRSRTLPEDHPHLQSARQGLAVTLKTLGDLPAARSLEEKVLEVNLRTLPDDHPALQRARMNLATTLWTLGDVAAARALQEKVLEVNSRTLPDDHPDLQKARGSLATTLWTLGDLAAARALQEKVLEVNSRTLPDDHPDLQQARGSLAATLWTLGDPAATRALQEKVLEVNSRTLPDDHPDLQKARMNLAVTLATLGDLAAARVLFEQVLEVDSRTLPDDHPDLQRARLNLANTLATLGDLAAARALFEQVLEVNSRTLPDDHPDLQRARGNLAAMLYMLGDLSASRALQERVLEVWSRTLPEDHPDLQTARGSLAGTLASLCASEGRGGEERRGGSEFARIVADHARALQVAARTAVRAPTGREAEERCVALLGDLGRSLSFASGLGVFAPDQDLDRSAFLASERTRGAAMLSSALTSRARTDARYEPLRVEVLRASEELARLAQAATKREEYERARSGREAAERALVDLSATLVGGAERFLEGGVETLSEELDERDALIGFRQYTGSTIDESGSVQVQEIASLCAFVVRADNRLERIELGPIAPIEEAVESWRKAIGVRLERGLSVESDELAESLRRGEELRALVFDPLLPALDGAERVIVALDDALHLVPLDALPLDETGVLVGERWRVETRATLLETLLDREEPRSGGLLALGHPAYDKEPVEVSAAVTAVDGQAANAAGESESVAPRSPEEAGVLRGGLWERGFATLPETRAEVRAIGDYFEDEFGDRAERLVLERAKASRESLFALASSARFVHLATHGWFAPESIRSWSDPEPIDAQLGFGQRLGGEAQVRGMNPMLLCGLALAGANLPSNTTGRVPGLVTAEELSALDLSNCELVVLSACDTNVGERRAGQGVASLQRALHMAGARSVITSLWKVPDEATRELMVDFYRRIWVEKKPKSQALWEAKMKLRNAKDESGEPLYTTRDWAAWVLSGDPN